MPPLTFRACLILWDHKWKHWSTPMKAITLSWRAWVNPGNIGILQEKNDSIANFSLKSQSTLPNVGCSSLILLISTVLVKKTNLFQTLVNISLPRALEILGNFSSDNEVGVFLDLGLWERSLALDDFIWLC